MKAYKQVWICPNCKCELILKSASGMTVDVFESCPECGADMKFLAEQSKLVENK